MINVVPQQTRRRRKKSPPLTWKGRAAAYFGTTERRIQDGVIPVIGLLILMLTVYWVVGA